jgi:hypothetical protein
VEEEVRTINALVIHGAWTKPGVDVGVEEIREWHRDRGFNDIGYVIRRDGKVEDGRPVDRVGAHVKGYNRDTIGICLVGGRESEGKHTDGLDEFQKQELLWEFNYTEAQIVSMIGLVSELKAEHDVTDVLGHRDYRGVTKRCPGFDVRAFFAR